jgi:hypothetical protein
MGFKKSLDAQNYNARGRPAGSSNQGKEKFLNDAYEQKHYDRHNEESENTKSERSVVKSNARFSWEIYHRGLGSKSVKRLLFIQEGLIGFEQLPLRNKMSEIINQSSEELQDIFMI